MAHLSPKLPPVSGLAVAVLLGLLCLPLVGARPYSGAQTALVIFGADTIRAGVADDYAERVQGLKGRTSVPDGTGLLFIFEEAAERSFWMIDTLIDLDIAFMDDDFRVIRIATMTAGTSDVTNSMGPASFALEVRAGWFAEKGIQAGDVAQVILDPGPGRAVWNRVSRRSQERVRSLATALTKEASEAVDRRPSIAEESSG